MIKYQIGNTRHQIGNIDFPAGEVGIRLNSQQPVGWSHPEIKSINIEAHLYDSDCIMRMLLLVDALRREYPGVTLTAFIPYVPYARQDRVCNQGEALSAAVMAQLINSCNFKEVVIADPHSDVITALINNVYVRTQFSIFGRLKSDWSNTHIVAPDNGAYKKATAFAKLAGAAGVIVCNKDRDLATGKITNLTMSADVKGLNLMVLDDICDGGRTFIELAKLVTAADKVELAVTHGLFTKGVDIVAKEFHHVYTTNSYTGVNAYVTQRDNFTVRTL